MTLSLYGIPHIRDIKKNIKNNMCILPIMFYGKGISFSLAESYKKEICVVNWYPCREIFHDDYPISNHLFVNHGSGDFNTICKFLQNVENIFGLEHKCEIYKTNRKTASLIVLGRFWKSRIMFTLLTLLVRFCLNNKKRVLNLKDVEKCKYLQTTYFAIQLLMEGKVRYNGRRASWYEQFCDLSLEESMKYLS